MSDVFPGGTINTTVNSINKVLKEFYLGPVQNQLNNEVMAVEMFEKGSFDWAGKQVVIPLKIGRNTGVGYRGEADTTSSTDLPDSGRQQYDRITCTSSFLYGRFSLTGPAIASARKGGKNSFVGALDGEMEGLVEDVKNLANETFFMGGGVVGFLNQRRASLLTTGAFVGGGAANSNSMDWEYSGSYLPFASVVKATTNTWVNVDLIRLDDYTVIDVTGGGAATAKGICVSSATSAKQAAGEIELTPVSLAAAGQGFTTATVDDGVAIAVRLSTVQLEDGVPANFGTTVSFANEPSGIFTNLADTSLFNIVRDDASGDAKILQSTVFTQELGNGNSGPLTLARLQNLLDEIFLMSGATPNVWIINPTMRQKYIGLLQANVQMNVQQPIQSGDAGFKVDGLGYSGIPFKVSRHCPRGMWVALKTDTWKMAELQSGGFADDDGSVLSRESGKDAWEGFYRWYYQLVCSKPNNNGILVGIELP
tara:strand:- start:3380 stop:4819 length:1440 start_codon:yes stop_codon:yes gene_type:complete